MDKCEQQTLINELKHGMEQAKQLTLHVGPSSTTETREYLVDKILSSYDKALLILHWRSESLGHASAGFVHNSLQPDAPRSLESSPHSEASHKGGFKDQPQQQEHAIDVSKKRKTQLPKLTHHVRIYSESGLEGPHEDGYSWRKYGQKDILGAIYPRSYYRCTYRNIKHCWATKQVQRSDEDPTVFEITYKGKHTCVPDSHPNGAHDLDAQSNPKDFMENQALLNLRNKLRVNIDDFHNKETVSQLPLISKLVTINSNHAAATLEGMFTSPAAKSVSPVNQNSSFDGGWFGSCSETDRSDIFSSNASTTNSPYLDLDFKLDPANSDQAFQYNTPGFLP